MLFEIDRHEPLSGAAWDSSRALSLVRSIVDDIERGRVAEGQWPVHPLDVEGAAPLTGYKSLYLGSAGVLWTLWYLHREGAATLTIDPVDGIRAAYASYLVEPDTGSVVPSYFLGQVGILLVLWRLTGSPQTADRLHACVQSNLLNPTNEALWAAPGTMLAAWHMWQATRDERWREQFLENIEQLWSTWDFDPAAQCHLWTQNLYGRVVKYLGAGHGFAGNAYALLKGAPLLEPQRREALYDRCLTTLRATCEVEGDALNWPPATTPAPAGRPRCLMQWCHGAPGMLTGLADLPTRSAEFESILLGAGRSVWQAGPLGKGYGLCHGTAGNGYAFLKLYQRTGDVLWLERARSFAMHAIGQRDRMRMQYGQGRYTLWNGDPGLAVYLWHCLDGTAALPALDLLQ